MEGKRTLRSEEEEKERKMDGRQREGEQAKRNRQMDCEKKALVVAGFCGR